MNGHLSPLRTLPRPQFAELSQRLLGPGALASELPALPDLLAVLLGLAEGARRKAILPLASSTGEFALVRRGEQVLVSYYDAGPVPQIFVRDRALPLKELLALATAAALEQSEDGLDAAERVDGRAGARERSDVEARAGARARNDAGLRIAERARRAVLKPDLQPAPAFVTRRAGALSAPCDAPLAFGFSAKLALSELSTVEARARARERNEVEARARARERNEVEARARARERNEVETRTRAREQDEVEARAQARERADSENGTRADVHALLFDGELWTFARGRKLTLVRGPIFPAIARMVSAARSVVEAWETQRPVSLKLKAGEFGISLRLYASGELRVSLSVGGVTVTLPALDLASGLSPILRLATDLVRTVVASDRAQSKNLRLCALRDEVRALRRAVRARGAQKSFVNRDPELLRAAASGISLREREVGAPGAGPESAGRLRLAPRWQAEVDGLDACSTFLCGDRIIVATARAQLALARDDGTLLWSREAYANTAFMAGASLLSVHPDGELTLCEIEGGVTYARTRIAPRLGGPIIGTFAGTHGGPPVAVLTEGRDRLVAIDTRTGAPRWRFRSPGRGEFRLARAGRILLVVSGESTLDAIDVATGEVAWRWSDLGRLSLAPAVTRDHALALATDGSGAALVCLDLFSGQLAFRRELSASPLLAPLATEQLAIVCTQQGSGSALTAFDLVSGRERWRSADPGLGDGGAPLVVDQQLVVNAPDGSARALELATGKLRWQQRLADPARDDVPRRLEPVLRGGALFLPSNHVHVVRPQDGSLIAGSIAERIIPDFMRVDERGWLYVAEESGFIEAHAPIPSLRLVAGRG